MVPRHRLPLIPTSPPTRNPLSAQSPSYPCRLLPARPCPTGEWPPAAQASPAPLWKRPKPWTTVPEPVRSCPGADRPWADPAGLGDPSLPPRGQADGRSPRMDAQHGHRPRCQLTPLAVSSFLLPPPCHGRMGQGRAGRQRLGQAGAPRGSLWLHPGVPALCLPGVTRVIGPLSPGPLLSLPFQLGRGSAGSLRDPGARPPEARARVEPAAGRGRTADGVPCTRLSAAGAPAGCPCLLGLQLVAPWPLRTIGLPGDPGAAGLTGLAGVPAPPVTSPEGEGPAGPVSRGGPLGLQGHELYRNLEEAHRLGEGGQAEGRGLCPRLLTGLPAARGRLTASPLCPRRPEARAGPPAHRAAPRAAADAPAFAAQGRAQEPEASPEPRIPRLQQPEAGPCPQPPGPGLESGPGRPLSEEPCGDGVPTSESVFSSVEWAGQGHCKDFRCVQKQPCSRQARVPRRQYRLTRLSAPVGFSSLSRPHPKAAARRKAFQTELHPSSADPAAPGGCSCQTGRPPPRLPRFLGALPAVELSLRGDFPY